MPLDHRGLQVLARILPPGCLVAVAGSDTDAYALTVEEIVIDPALGRFLMDRDAGSPIATPADLLDALDAWHREQQ